MTCLEWFNHQSVRRNLKRQNQRKLFKGAKQLHGINLSTLVLTDKVYQFLENINSQIILDVIWQGVPGGGISH